MKIAVLGTGVVGQTIAGKLIQLGHLVIMGSRSATNEKAVSWATQNGERASVGTFAEAATFGEIIFLATKGDVTLEIIQQAKPENFSNKTVIDISNPLDFSNGFPPALSISNTNSLAEKVQKAIPEAYVVKTLNTLTAQLMVEPSRLPEETHIFLSGNHAAGKEQARALLQEFGWQNQTIIDLGDITTARGTEQFLPLWVRLYGALGTPNFNFKLVRESK
ncbi:NADP oxidoreductase [Adhaeribacter arboris]|uniref:NADP oxidoreductase n=1 Tax=Adhaeribacter arboris TaxID=2072846 RepID=A0A2T2YE95_9BACT|nr:NAD(P)-binding domain-containing protein [Adhaeribacter arboris]PSR53835.1 NADP oxidoreductase [Adhaeribacter arboris]